MLAFPREGQENLICDILARDNEGLRYLASDITAFLLYPSKYSRIQKQITRHSRLVSRPVPETTLNHMRLL